MQLDADEKLRKKAERNMLRIFEKSIDFFSLSWSDKVTCYHLFEANRKGGLELGYASDERRRLIVEYLSLHKTTTIAQIADEFQISYCTAQRDITYLTRFYSISTTFGRYTGGIEFHGENVEIVHFTPKQEKAVRQAIPKVSAQDAVVLKEILQTFCL